MRLTQKLSTATILATGAVFGALLTVGITVFADGNPATDNVPRMIPYQGILEMNGQPVNAQGNNAILIAFELFDGPNTANPTYSQTIPVEVFAGRFTALLGPMGDNGTSIASVITAADDLHLGMTLLNGDGNGNPVTLNNRQRILASPYAMWSTNATNFTIANQLNVGGNATVGGDLDIAGNSNVDDNLTVRGRITPSGGNDADKGISFTTSPGDGGWIRYFSEGQQGSRLQFGIDDEANDRLEFYQDGAVRMRVVDHNVNVETDLNVTGNVAVTGNVNVSGTFSYHGITVDNSDCHQGGNDKTDCYCPEGTIVIGGGGYAQQDNTIREMRAVQAENRWRISCGGTDNRGHCAEAYALCATILP